MKRLISIAMVVMILCCGCGNKATTSQEIETTQQNEQQGRQQLGDISYVIPTGYVINNSNSTTFSYKNSNQDVLTVSYISADNGINSDSDIKDFFDSFYKSLTDTLKISNKQYYKYQYGSQSSFEFSYKSNSAYTGNGFIFQTSNGFASFILGQIGNNDTKQYSSFFNSCMIDTDYLTKGTPISIDELSVSYSSINPKHEETTQVTTQKETSKQTTTKEQIVTSVESTIGYFSQSNYNKLSEGMTYNEVVAIIGEPTERMSYVEAGSETASTYSWQKENGSNCIILFSNGTLYTKAIFWID